jgi:GT2 family glycosyltransferase
MTRDCSIVIPLFNRVDLTAQCLRSLIANTAGVDYEVVIVDNGSTDATPELCAGLGGSAVVIRNEENLGFAAACNQGARAASSDRVLFLNNDTQPMPNWLPPLLDTMESEPDVGAVGCKLLFPDGTVQHGGVVLVEREDYPTLGAMHMPYRVPADDPLANLRRDVSVATAASILVRREAFEAAGGFDEGYWNGYEDVDLCLTLGDLGWRLVYEPASVLIHHESASGPERFSKTDANIDRLQQKWAGNVVPDFVVDGTGDARPHPEGIHARAGRAAPVRG